MYLTDAILDQWSHSATVERYALQAWNDYDLRLDDGYPIVDRYEWNASEHPRFEAGAPGSVGGEFRPANRPGGAVSQKFIDSGMSPNATRWIQDSPQADRQEALQAAVKSALQTPVQPAVKGKRELAALPDIQKGHQLHHSSLSPELQGKLLDWNGRINQLLNPLNIAGSGYPAGETRDAVKEEAWKRMDKAPIRAMLDEMNHMDREARKFGVPLSDFVNANGIIPRELAERLGGGSRFFDPEKLRGKLKSTGDNTAQTSVRDFKEAPKHIRNEMKSNPSIREAIERAMGLKPSDGTNKPEPPMEGLVKAPEPKPMAPQVKAPEAKPVEPPKPKPVSITKHLPEANRALRALGYKPAEAGALLRKTMAAGGSFESADDLVKAALTGGTKQGMSDNLSSAGSNKLSKVIDEVVGGDDLDKKEHFKQVALDAWKEAKAVADNHNDALRQLTSFFGKHHGAMAANLSKGVDVTSIKGFDELIDHAVREYPQLISRLGSESSAGGPEDALVEALKEGIREVPQPWDDSVIDRAMEMVGPGFFEDTSAMADAPDNPIDWEEESTPFSVRGDVLRWVQRYWCSADEMRLAAVSEWVDKYSLGNHTPTICGDPSFPHSPTKSCRSDPQNLSDSASACSIFAKRPDDIEVNGNSMKLRSVTASVYKHEVFDSVIKPVEGPTNALLHNPPVLTGRFPVSGNSPVFEPVFTIVDSNPPSVVGASALSGTKEPTLGGRPCLTELYSNSASTVQANSRDLRHVILDGKKVSINVNPSEAQKEAGCYKMGHFKIHGLPVTIETPKGFSRRDGWPKMAAHYGYIKGTEAVDGDAVDVFIGPHLDSEMVYVVDQVKPNGKWDEFKCMLGFRSKEAAIAAYRDSYKLGWIVGRVTAMTIDQFKAWLEKGDQTKPIAPQVSRYSQTAIALCSA